MGAFRFNSALSNVPNPGSQGEMYGYLSLPSHGQGARHGVLLCSPFGQEAVRCHRMYRVLAENLARAGVACLRFDYLGTGDSDGEDHELTLETCVQNTLRADQELRTLAGCTHVSWFGLRFGAAVAARSSRQAATKPDRLFLWDPIADGPAWIEQLKHEHSSAVAVLADAVSQSVPLRAKLTDSKPPIATLRAWKSSTGIANMGFESLGFIVGDQLHQDIATIVPEQYADSRCARLILLAVDEHQRQSFSGLDYAKHVHSYEMQQVEPAYWNNDEAISSAIVARDVITLVVQEMAGGGR